ncbi:hypothetical protein, partial [Burkholderia sp. SIMBA_024]|uniref:hypothetical protein n=1 Tax=Burkholderia sp. SIMBA_024 TaxID=3085768 RepID=UPI00397B81D0
GIAMMAKMPVPTKQVGNTRNGPPKIVRCGASPFDFYGMSLLDARFIGMEAKATRPMPSLRVVMPQLSGKKIVEGKGTGLKYHQLESLAQVAAIGGIARWSGTTAARCW